VVKGIGSAKNCEGVRSPKSGITDAGGLSVGGRRAPLGRGGLDDRRKKKDNFRKKGNRETIGG